MTTKAAQKAKEIDTSIVTPAERQTIKASFSQCCASCGMRSFSGLYKIISAAHAKAILQELTKVLASPGFQGYCIAASAPSQTSVIEQFMLDGGWTKVGEFPQAHGSGVMTLWGGLGIT